jgi:antitoxin component YwqK of YwqJK toxin-antitoxin module
MNTIRSIGFLLCILVTCPTSFAQPIEFEGATYNETLDGKKEGQWIYFARMRDLAEFAPDAKVEEGTYKSNRKAGIWTKYYSNGNIQSEIEYANGRPRGSFKTYYKTGVLEEEGTWKNNVYQKEFKRWHPNGTIAQEKVFNEKGQTNGKVTYTRPDGTMEIEFTTINGKKTGTSTRLWPNGNVKEVITYDAEGNVGNRVTTDRVDPPKDKPEPSGKEGPKLQGKANMGETVKDGYQKTFNDNNDILMDGTFEGGVLMDGKLYIYDEDGLLEKIEIYLEGKFSGNGVIGG